MEKIQKLMYQIKSILAYVGSLSITLHTRVVILLLRSTHFCVEEYILLFFTQNNLFLGF